MISQERSPHLLKILLIAVLPLLLYTNSLRNGFVFDDGVTVVNNALIKDFRNLPKLAQKDYFNLSGEMTYRPVVTLTYFLDYFLYGLKPWGYHLTNVLLHAANSMMFYIFLVLLAKQSGVGSRESGDRSKKFGIRNSKFGVFIPHPSSLIPLLASLFFAAHPVLTEAVNAVSFREDLLVFLFYMAALSLYIYISPGTRKAVGTGLKPAPTYILYLFSCILYFLALLSKEMAATLPLIILCYGWLYGDKNQLKNSPDSLTPSLLKSTTPGIKGLGGVIGYVVVTVFYLYLRFYYFYNPAEEAVRAWSLTERFLTVPYLLVSYLKLALFPVSLSADYVIKPAVSIFSPSFIFPFFSLGLLLVFSFISRHRRTLQKPVSLAGLKPESRENPYGFTIKDFGNDKYGDLQEARRKAFLFGSLFFIITLLPVYNIIPLINPFAERYLYLPLAGFVVIMGIVIYTLQTRNRKVLYILFLPILCIFALMVVKRNAVWRDASSLWTDTVKKMPESWCAHNNLGVVFHGQGRLDDAISEYLTALRLNPYNPDAHNNIGNAYSAMGYISDAVMEYKEALRLRPDFAEAHNNLGLAYYSLGNLDSSLIQFKEALKIRPDFADAYTNLGIVYGSKGMTAEAVNEFKEALRFKPGHIEANYNLGVAYSLQGDLEEAIRAFKIVIRLKPAHAKAHFHLGLAYKEMRLWADSARAFKEALRLDPTNVEARQALESLR